MLLLLVGWERGLLCFRYWKVPDSPRPCVLSRFSYVQLFATPWTLAHQTPPVHGILQARILEWVAMSFFRGSSRPRDLTCISYISGIGIRRSVLYH